MKFDVGGNNRSKREETIYTEGTSQVQWDFGQRMGWERFCFGLLKPKNVPMIIGFPQSGSPFVELIVLIDFQNTSPNDERYKHLVIVAHTYMIFEKGRRGSKELGEGRMWVRTYTTKNLQVAASSWTLRTRHLNRTH